MDFLQAVLDLLDGHQPLAWSSNHPYAWAVDMIISKDFPAQVEISNVWRSRVKGEKRLSLEEQEKDSWDTDFFYDDYEDMEEIQED